MSKKKITGTSKLNVEKLKKPAGSTLNLIKRTKDKILPKSFRLRESDVNNLRLIHTEINKICPAQISETKILRALISIGTTTTKERIINAIRKLM